MTENLPEYSTAVNDPVKHPTWEEMFPGVPRIRRDEPAGCTFVDKVAVRIYTEAMGMRTEMRIVSMWPDGGLYLNQDREHRYYFQETGEGEALFIHANGAKIWIDAALAQFIWESVEGATTFVHMLFEMMGDGYRCDPYAKYAEFLSELSAEIFLRVYPDWKVYYKTPLLYEMLGDGVELDTTRHRAIFRSQHSAEIFRRRYPYYQVGHINTEPRLLLTPQEIDRCGSQAWKRVRPSVRLFGDVAKPILKTEVWL